MLEWVLFMGKVTFHRCQRADLENLGAKNPQQNVPSFDVWNGDYWLFFFFLYIYKCFSWNDLFCVWIMTWIIIVTLWITGLTSRTCLCLLACADTSAQIAFESTYTCGSFTKTGGAQLFFFVLFWKSTVWSSPTNYYLFWGFFMKLNHRLWNSVVFYKAR